MNQTVFPPVLIGDPDLTPCELAAKQTSWKSKLKSFFKQAITYTVLASLQLGTLVQTKEAYAQYVQYGGQPSTGYVAPTTGAISGYTNDGTLFMGGQRIGNPHQILHDAQIPSFMNITATRFTFTDNPNHGQGTLLQMSQATTAGSDASVLLNRLYLSPTNPYVQGAPGPYPNYQTYQGVLQNAQQANFLLTNADDGKTYAFKTLTAANAKAVDLLIRELPNTQQFRDKADPLGGGVGVRVTQNGDAVALAAYLATVKPYDYSWQPNFGTTFGQNGGQNPNNGAFSGWANSNNFARDYSEGAGPAQSFDAFIKQLRDDAVKNDKTVRSQTSANSLDLSGVNPNSLFGEGYNLFEYGSNSNPNRELENDFLRRLQSGQLTAGTDAYNEASRIAQERYRIAYATRLETGKALQYSVADSQRKANELNLDQTNPNKLFGDGYDLFKYAQNDAERELLRRLQSGQLAPGSAEYEQAKKVAQQSYRIAYSNQLAFNIGPKYSVADAQRKANEMDLSQVNPNELFGQGFDLFQYNPALRPNGAAENELLQKLQSGQLQAGSSDYTQAVEIAKQRLREAYSISLVPPEPKKVPKWKQIAAVVVGAVVTFVSGGVLGPFLGSIASNTILTGSLSQGIQAGFKTLVSGSIKDLVAGIVANALGLSGLEGIAATLGKMAVSTISGGVTQTIMGGGSFADNLKAAAISSVITAVADGIGEKFAKDIKNADLGAVGTELAHGALGCVTGMIRAQSGSGCVPGAAGAVVGHLGAGWVDAASGYTLDDRTLSFYSGVAGGAVAAAVGKDDKVNANYGIGDAAAVNAVDNNYLTGRAVIAARAIIAANCANGCDRLMNGLEQTSARSSMDLRGQCSKAPEACSVTLKSISDGLKELQSPASQQAFASNPEVLQRLIQRQINDLDQATQGVNFALQNSSSLEAIRTVAAVATLGTGVTLLGRVLATACAANPAGCTTFANEAAIVMSEAASGVPFTGLTSPVVGATALGTAAAANRLANAASNGGDMAAAVRQAQTDLAAARAGVNGGVPPAMPAGSVRNVNPTGSAQNCTNCAFVVENQLATGANASALPLTRPVAFSELNGIYNTQMSGWTTRLSIEESLLQGGEGSRAIVYGMNAGGDAGHVWNAVVQNGRINYIDGQTGGSGVQNFNNFPHIRFGKTN